MKWLRLFICRAHVRYVTYVQHASIRGKDVQYVTNEPIKITETSAEVELLWDHIKAWFYVLKSIFF